MHRRSTSRSGAPRHTEVDTAPGPQLKPSVCRAMFCSLRRPLEQASVTGSSSAEAPGEVRHGEPCGPPDEARHLDGPGRPVRPRHGAVVAHVVQRAGVTKPCRMSSGSGGSPLNGSLPVSRSSDGLRSTHASAVPSPMGSRTGGSSAAWRWRR